MTAGGGTLRRCAAAISAMIDLNDPASLALLERWQRARRRARLFAGSAFGVWLLGMATPFASLPPWWWLASLAASLGLFVIHERHARRAQIWRARYVARCARSDPRPPVLLLRSFSHPVLTAKRPQVHVRGGVADGIAGITFLMHFSEATAPFAGTLALGAPAGNQRTEAPAVVCLQTSDTTWFEVFRAAAIGCRAVVLIPETSDGSACEIRALTSLGLTDKLLVFVPPTDKPAPAWTPIRTQEPDAIAQRWSDVRQAWAADGYRLPAYNPAGLLYRAAPDLSVRQAVELTHSLTISVLRDAIGSLLPPVSAGVPMSAMLANLEVLGAVPLDDAVGPVV